MRVRQIDFTNLMHDEGSRNIYYVAGPYSYNYAAYKKTPEKSVQYHRFLQLTELAAKVMTELNVLAFSPITHGHPIAENHDLPVDYDFWQKHCEEFVDRCDAVLVLKLPGWKVSTGTQTEIQFALKKNKDVWLVCPRTGTIEKYERR